MSQTITLTQVAIDLLNVAATQQADERKHFSEARGIWQPDTWLLQRCWHALAEAGATAETMEVAALAAERQPLAPYQALHRLSQRIPPHSTHFSQLQDELIRLCNRLFGHQPDGESTLLVDRLLHAAAAAAQMDEQTLAFACLERLDQVPRAWDRVFVHPEMRLLLAETVARVGLQPLTAYLIGTAIRHFSETGAQFVQQVATALHTNDERPLARRQQRVLQRCVDALHNAVLLTLHSRRIAATVMAQAGEIDELLKQLETIATIQEAHRETGHAQRSAGASFGSHGAAGAAEGDGVLLRQVTRPHADADIDFQVYTLQNAVEVLPLEQVSPRQRRALARRVADLGLRSDGWTAAGAISTLIKLGDADAAIRVMDQIPVHDPTRSEGVLSLIGGLLAGGHPQPAVQQAEKAMQWAKSLDERTPERAITWGLAAAFLQHGMAEMALKLLGESPEPTWGERLGQLLRGRWPGGVVTDEMLRSDRIRLQALLLRAEEQPDPQNGAVKRTAELPPEIDALVRRVTYWAPQLLDGETLLNFYVEGLLRPLLAAGKVRYAWGLLPQLQEVLQSVRGAKYAAHVAEITVLLADSLDPALAPAEPHDAAQVDAMRRLLAEFVVALWQNDAEHGIWRAVYGVDGALPLLLRLGGPAPVLEIARAAAGSGARWSQ